MSAVSTYPQYTYDVRNATAWCFFAFVSTGVDAALVLEQVAIIPIPGWWPFQGMQIPEDDNMGAPMVSLLFERTTVSVVLAHA